MMSTMSGVRTAGSNPPLAEAISESGFRCVRSLEASAPSFSNVVLLTRAGLERGRFLWSHVAAPESQHSLQQAPKH